MKPLTLEMNAFGPFCKKQLVDFSDLMGRNIFLITGPTGAGKTTVFDAVCFALYGDTSGESRQNDSLKSQFADINEKSYVTFSFSVKGKNYTVTRYPKQQKLGRNGDVRMENSSVRLFMENGETLTGVSANRQLEQIIGLSKEQFKKVVMLPQGEFRRLLEDKSDAKQEILRRIFSTDLFADFTESLKEKARLAEQKTQQISADNKAVLKSLALSDADEELKRMCAQEYPDVQAICGLLGQKLKEDEKSVLKIKALADDCFSALNKIDLKYASQINQKFERFDEQTALFRTLCSEKDNFSQKQKMLDKLKLCATYRQSELTIEKLKKEIDSLRREIKENEGEYKKICLAVKKARSENEKLPEYESRSEELLRQIASFDTQLDSLNRIDKTRREILKLNSEIFKTQEKIVLLDECKAVCEQMKEADNLKKQLELLDMLDKKLGDFNGKYAEFYSAQTACLRGYERFYRSAASVLAKELKDGEPCPVCGSRSHPRPCEDDGGENVTKQRLSELERQRDICSAAMQSARRDCAAVIAQYNASAEEKLDEEGVFSDSESARITADGLRARASDLERAVSEKKELLAKSEFFCGEMLETEYVLRERESCLTAEAGFIGQRQRLSESVKKESGGQSARELRSFRDEASKKLDIIKKDAKRIREEFSSVLAEKKRLSEAIKRLEDFCGAKTQELSDENLRLKQFEAENGIDKSVVSELSGKTDMIQPLESEIAGYTQRVKICKVLLDSLKSELDGKQRFDIDRLKREQTALEVRYNTLNAEYIDLSSRLKQNISAHREISQNLQKAGSAQEDTQRLMYLASLAKGDNEQRISFERFVLTAYFEEVIEAANQRLSGLTDQRYTLFRKQEKEKNGRGSGLELSVFDAYSGMLRDVTTLSGGESFKAALSLALGMADVISRHVGGVEVDTVFIDEGFGSLDEQSLDSAVSCLMDLQTDGRLVGIISHVELLKEKIGAKLVVTPAKNGSSLKFIVE